MSLTEADVDRLEQAGHRNFYSQDESGYLRIKNVDGHCIFLEGARCVVYPDRPEGCVLYPLILFTDTSEVDLHSFCPYRHEFTFASGDREWLRRSIAREEAEVASRLRTNGN
jgi:Fe-S-cluster containining protein